MMERGVGKMEVSIRDEFGVAHTVHVDPDATVESIHEQLRELTGVSRDTQAQSHTLTQPSRDSVTKTAHSSDASFS